jgi:anti-anti-sigma factor
VSELARIEATDLDGARLVRVSGEIDLSNAREVMDAIGQAVPNDAVLVVLDLSETAYLDSAGIAMIYRLAEQLGHSRQQLRLVVPPGAPIRRVLELTSVHRVITIQNSISETRDSA